jgi:superfamily II DNA or RNA helicase
MPSFRAFADELTKLSAVVHSKLEPHQRRVIEKLKKSHGVVAAHRLGGGKTLTAIAAGAELGMPMEVVVPASLRGNFEKEVAKHTTGDLPRRVRSYAKATRDGKAGIDTLHSHQMVVLDEAHKLRNQGTAAYKHVAEPARYGAKRLLLTGTPIYNRPSDLSILANIAAGEKRLPENPLEFDKRFIVEEEVKPSFFQRLQGIQPGIRRRLTGESEIENALRGHVDLYEGDSGDYPRRVDRVVNVPMSPKQLDVHRALIGKAPRSLRNKIRAGLPPSKQESKNLNKYLAAARQSSLSPRPYVANMTFEEEREHIPKLRTAADRLTAMSKKDKNFRGVVYSNYLDAGIRPYSHLLSDAGVEHKVISGTVSKKDRAQAVTDYNEGRTPVLLVSSAGGEGLDLQGTKLVQVLEPHFNNSKVEQVIGRGIRYRSHAHLPEKEREVAVERYFSTEPPTFFDRNPVSTEQWLQQRADDKDEVGNQMRRILKRLT